MRQIVYDNIMEIIKRNESWGKQMRNGVKCFLVYPNGNQVILSTYRNHRKIELFLGDKLFASCKTPTLFNKEFAHYHQLYNIECALRGCPNTTELNKWGIKRTHGTTPAQTAELMSAWIKSPNINHKMLCNLGNAR